MKVSKYNNANNMFPSILNEMMDMFNTGMGDAVSPPVNIKETDSTYELEIVAPGINKQDINIKIEEDMLRVSYEHQESSEETNEGKYIRREYRSQTFSRSFHIPKNADMDNIKANYAEGVLNVVLPKKEVVKVSQNIEVQ